MKNGVMINEVRTGIRLELYFLGINKEIKIIMQDNCPYLCEKNRKGKTRRIRIFLKIPFSLFLKIPIIKILKDNDKPCRKALFDNSNNGQENLYQ